MAKFRQKKVKRARLKGMQFSGNVGDDAHIVPPM